MEPKNKKVVVLIGQSYFGKIWFGKRIEKEDPLYSSFCSITEELFRQETEVPFQSLQTDSKIMPSNVTDISSDIRGMADEGRKVRTEDPSNSVYNLSLTLSGLADENPFACAKQNSHKLVKTALNTFVKSSKTLMVLDFITDVDDAQFLVQTLRKYGLNPGGSNGFVAINLLLSNLHKLKFVEERAKRQRVDHYVMEYLKRHGAEALYFTYAEPDRPVGFFPELSWIDHVHFDLLIQLLKCTHCLKFCIEYMTKLDGESYKSLKSKRKAGFKADDFEPAGLPNYFMCKNGHKFCRPSAQNDLTTKYVAPSSEFDFDVPLDFMYTFGCWQNLLALTQNWNSLVLDQEISCVVTGNLLSVLKIKQFHFMLPATFLSSINDVKWLVNSNQYYVAYKRDGVRHLLFKKTSTEVYLFNSAKELFECQLAGSLAHLPDGTVLDGELLNCQEFDGQMSVFVAFDVLSLGIERQWHLKFKERQLALESTGVGKESEILGPHFHGMKSMEKGAVKLKVDMK